MNSNPKSDNRAIEMQAVLADLRAKNGDKAALMQEYSNKQKEIVKQYGGSLSDVPADSEHPYYKLQNRINVLGRL